MGRPCFALSVLMSLLAGSLLAVGTAHGQIMIAVLELDEVDRLPTTTFKFLEEADEAGVNEETASAGWDDCRGYLGEEAVDAELAPEPANDCQEMLDEEAAAAIDMPRDTALDDSAEVQTDAGPDWTWECEPPQETVIDGFEETCETPVECPYEACYPVQDSPAPAETADRTAIIEEAPEQSASSKTWWRYGVRRLHSGLANMISIDWLKQSGHHVGNAWSLLEHHHARLTVVNAEASADELQDVAIEDVAIEDEALGIEEPAAVDAESTAPAGDPAPTDQPRSGASPAMLLEAADMVEDAEGALHRLASYLRYLAGANLAEQPATATVR